MLRKVFAACIIIFLGCNPEVDFIPVVDIPPEFQPYVDSFVSAAHQRGNNLVINNLIITYDSSISNEYCAYSNVVSAENNVQKKIFLNPNIHCWQNSMQLETLLFHEMGHCILGREHDTSLLPNGDAKSIMYPGDITLYAPCNYPLGDSCNKLYKRDYYLDELFEPGTPVPDWAK